MASSSGLPQTGVELVAANLQGFLTSLNTGNQAVAGFGKGMDTAGQRTSAASQVMIGALRQVGMLATNALLQAGRALIGFGQDSLRLAGDFDQGMRQFQVAAGQDLDTKGLQEFHDLFLQIGKDLPVSTAQVQQAATEMVKGGLDPAILAAGGLKQNIQFASAAMGGDLVGAATISAKVVAGWAAVGATAEQKAALLAHSTDLLTKAANASSVDVHELSLGLFNVQATAKNAGISLDDVTTVLAELSGDFASSSEAGNSMASFITRLHPQTKAATEAMESLGLVTKEGGNAFYDAQGNFVGFQKASEILRQSLQGLNNEQRQQIMQTIFQKDAMGVAAGLASRGAAGYDAMAASLQNAMGVAAAGTTVQAGYNTAVENAQGGLEALKITLGEKLLPFLTEFYNFLNNSVLTTLINVTDAIFGNDKAFNALSPTLQAVVMGLSILVADVQDTVGAFTSAGAASTDFASAIGYLAGDLGLPGDLISEIVLGIGTLVEGFKNAGGVSQQLNQVIVDLSDTWDNLQYTIEDVGQGYLKVAQAILPIVTKFWEDHGTEITEFLQTAYNKIISIINLALALYDAIVPKILGGVAKYITKHATDIQTILTGAWNVISGGIDAALTLIQGIFKIALDALNGNWSQAWEDLKTMSATFVLDLQKIITGFLDIIAGFFGSSLKQITETWTANWNQLVDIATSIDWQNVGYMVIAGIIGGIDDNADRLVSTLKNLASDALQAAKDALGIKSPSTAFAAVGSFAIEGFLEGIEGMWPQVTSLMTDLGGNLVDQAEGIAKSIQGAIAEAFGATATIDRQKMSNLDAVADLSEKRQAGVQQMLDVAEAESQKIADPKKAQEYFTMRSKQLLELAKLSDQIEASKDDKEKARLTERYQLLNAANLADIAQFNANLQAGTGTQDLIAQIQKLMMDTKIGVGDSPVLAQLSMLLDHLLAGVTQVTQQSGYALPMMASQYSTGSNSSYQTNNQATYNMPIYTNNSPAALQQSFALLQAMAPT